ncbi:MAG TPA: LD-carboxypeptidase [Verrucomicrobiae bacterium]|nr:LD-carboxypeptidase [Verrucomicrobiae bacterium]
MPLRPAHLNQGDTLAIVAPASAPANPANIDLAITAVQRLGFNPLPSKNLRKRNGFLAGTDSERAQDLMGAFTEPSVKGIVCLRGGYGSARLLSMLDYKVIGTNPKIFVGYSDLTSLHCALLVKSDLISFHGPMLNSDFLKPNIPSFTIDGFLRTLTRVAPAGSVRSGYRRNTVRVLCPGTAKGPLMGGNLSILCASLGTPYQPSFSRAILFLEDLDEEPYRFDRMLTQLLNAGLLQQVAGIAIGINKNCKDPKAGKSNEFRQTLDDVIKERLLPLGVPVVCGLPFGHVRHNATLPVGAEATLDGDKGDLLITEPAVR